MPMPTPISILAPSNRPLPEGSCVDSEDVAVAAVAAVSGRIDVGSCGLDDEVLLVEVAMDDEPRVYW